MPQGPIATTIATESGKAAPATLDATGNLITGQGLNTTLGITTQTVVALGPVRIAKAIIQVAGTTNGAIYDASTTASAGLTTLQIASLTSIQVGPLSLDFPLKNGLLVVPGAGQTVAVSYK